MSTPNVINAREDLEALKNSPSMRGQEDVLKVLEAINLPSVIKNANEVEHTTQTGYGKELVPVNVLSDQVLELIPKYSTILPALPGFHGSNMGATEKVPVIGEVGLMQPNTEWTTGDAQPGSGNAKLATAEISITQGQFILKVPVSKRLLTYSVIDLEALITRKLAEAAARTVEALLWNADSNAGATGNVNSDDQAPSATADYFMEQDNGMRKLALASAAMKLDVGTLDYADIVGVAALLGDLGANPADCMYAFNRATYNKALTLTEFKDASQNGKKSTINDGAVENIAGSDVFIARDLVKTAADGKSDRATPANNVKGQFLYFHTAAPQYGFGQPLEIDVVRVPGKGVMLVATMEVGMAIANLLAGQTDPSLAVGYDVTL